MDYINYLKTYQPIPYQIFENAFKHHKIFHAYLLVGEKGTPLLNIAKFLAASIIDPKSSPFADQNSLIFERIFNENYVDLRVFDSTKGQIKIDEIRQLETDFAKTSSEKYSKRVYIINLVENLSIDATNALLKFLEEPLSETYAFLTTENDKRILPTVLSRVQTVHFSLLPQEDLIHQALALEVDEKEAEILSFFYNDAELIKENKDNNKINKIIELGLNTLSCSSYPELLNYLLNTVFKTLQGKEEYRQFYDLLIVIFKETIKVKYKAQTVLSNYDKILNKLISLNNIEDKVLTLMDARNEINFNLNLNLLTYSTFNKIFGN